MYSIVRHGPALALILRPFRDRPDYASLLWGNISSTASSNQISLFSLYRLWNNIVNILYKIRFRCKIVFDHWIMVNSNCKSRHGKTTCAQHIAKSSLKHSQHITTTLLKHYQNVSETSPTQINNIYIYILSQAPFTTKISNNSWKY